VHRRDRIATGPGLQAGRSERAVDTRKTSEYLRYILGWVTALYLVANHLMPVTSQQLRLTIVAMSGLPPLAGFGGKWLLLSAMMEKGWYASALMTLLATFVGFVYMAALSGRSGARWRHGRFAARNRRGTGFRSTRHCEERNRRIHGIPLAGDRHHHAVSIVSLGLRPGAVVALSIPLTMAIVFPIMEYLRIDLQRISLGALIIALGLLVDDAMTTVDVMTSRMAAGDSKEKAATVAYQSLAFPMLTGSFVTAAGFVPIGFARSAVGEYTFSIFVVGTIALIVSWFVAVLFAPLLGVWLLNAPNKTAPQKPSRIVGLFRSILVAAMRHRWSTIALALACFVFSLLMLPLVLRQFFPASDRPELVVDLTLRQNASIYASDKTAAKLDAMLKDDPDVASWSTYVGRGAIRFYPPLNVQLNNDFFAQSVVIAKDVAARARLHAALEKRLAEELPSVVARISPLELGPPVGWPIQYRVSGFGRLRCSSDRSWALTPY
jgi:hypothetical protein